ncbi:hypothetical protein IEQ34_020730 [Dendrobium chrysotoxum]|uniref:Uncharacterized protein n=1 Tax=Dendrobium chrysotoxum TaxID=161865 RepID=A0AAV7G2S7_DENCH|nr:hypothetical protein IEQ34_020730 [Dendrobium chrysotoxum]
MEALQKLKTLALQCTAASPLLSFRRRKTLRRILRSPFSSRRRRRHADLPRMKQAAAEKKPLIAGSSLKDLFVKSPPPSPPVLSGGGGDSGSWKRIAVDGLSGSGHRGVVIGRRVGLAGLRYRLLRPAWRPKLVAIPELRTEDAELIL